MGNSLFRTCRKKNSDTPDKKSNQTQGIIAAILSQNNNNNSLKQQNSTSTKQPNDNSIDYNQSCPLDINKLMGPRKKRRDQDGGEQEEIGDSINLEPESNDNQAPENNTVQQNEVQAKIQQRMSLKRQNTNQYKTSIAEKQLLSIVNLFKSHPFFYYLTNVQIENMISNLDYYICDDSHPIFNFGDDVQGQFIVDKGKLQQSSGETPTKFVDITEYSSIIGEDDIIYKQKKRSSSLKVKKYSAAVWFINARKVRQIIKNIIKNSESEILSYINHGIHQKFLTTISKIEQSKLSAISKYDRNDIIIDSNSDKRLQDPYLQYIILEGSATLIIENESTRKNTAVVTKQSSSSIINEEKINSKKSSKKNSGWKINSETYLKPEESSIKINAIPKNNFKDISENEILLSQVSNNSDSQSGDEIQFIKLKKNQIFSAKEFLVSGKKRFRVKADKFLRVAIHPIVEFENRVKDPSFYYASNLVKKILNIQKELKGFLNDKFVEQSANMELKMVPKDTTIFELGQEETFIQIPQQGDIQVTYPQTNDENKSNINVSSHNNLKNSLAPNSNSPSQNLVSIGARPLDFFKIANTVVSKQKRLSIFVTPCPLGNNNDSKKAIADSMRSILNKSCSEITAKLKSTIFT